MGKRELVALLNLSSWCLMMVERLFLAVPGGCLQFVIVVFPDHTHLLFFKPSSKIFLLTVPMRYFFCGSFMLFLSCDCFAFVRVCLLFVALWSPAGKGLTSWLSFVTSNCEFVTFPMVSCVRCGT